MRYCLEIYSACLLRILRVQLVLGEHLVNHVNHSRVLLFYSLLEFSNNEVNSFRSIYAETCIKLYTICSFVPLLPRSESLLKVEI